MPWMSWALFGLGALLFVLGGVHGVAAALQRAAYRRRRGEGMLAEAIVGCKTVAHGDSGDWHFAEIRFTDASDNDYRRRHWVAKEYFDRVEEGATVRVWYLPEPSSAGQGPRHVVLIGNDLGPRSGEMRSIILVVWGLLLMWGAYWVR